MKLYNKIENILRHHEEILHVDSDVKDQDVHHAVRRVMRDNPDIFWFVHQYDFDQKRKTISFRYQFSKERSELIQKSIEDVVKNDFQIEYVRTLGVYEQIMYVYKWIALYCKYNIYSAYNQTIYSVFVCRNSVCTGYAKAAQYLFNMLGIESRLVFGTIHNAEKGSRHCWLLVKYGNLWYHLDPTFAVSDTSDLLAKAGITPIYGTDGLVYSYFCCDAERVKQSRTIEEEEKLPNCNAKLDYQLGQNIKVKFHRDIDNAKTGVKGCLLSDSGEYSSVYIWHSGDKIQKVAKYFKNNLPNSRMMRHESHIMQELNSSSHVIHFYGTTDDDKGIVIEQATPLADLLCTPHYQMSAKTFCKLLVDIVNALSDCVDHSIFYHDLHLNNIYKNREGNYVLGDFGCCKWIKKKNPSFTDGLCPWYATPEEYNHGIGFYSSLTYGVGMLAYYLLNELFPPLWKEYGLDSVDKRCSGHVLPYPASLEHPKSAFERKVLSVIMKSLSYETDNRYGNLYDLKNDIVSCQKLIDDDYILINMGLLADKEQVNYYATTMQASSYREAVDKFSITKEINPNSEDIFIQIQEEEREEERARVKERISTKRGRIEEFVRKEYMPGSVPYRVGTANLSPQLKTKKTSLFSLWSKLFGKRNQNNSIENVYCSAFAPAEVKPKSHMIIQVYLHLLEETEKVRGLAQESDENAERRDYFPLQCKLKRGDKVDVLLNIYGEMLLMSEKKNIVWQGSFTKCSFDYFVPKNIDEDELSCVAFLTVNEIPVGEMRFITRIVDSPRQLNPEIIAHKYNKVFISYAHKDELKVKSFHEGLKLAGIEHFFDRAYLQAGDIFPQIIQDYINSADLFVLFWSENAAESEYVQKERKQALERAFPQVKPQQEAKLSIYPMSIEPRAELPSDMKDNYHFGEI